VLVDSSQLSLVQNEHVTTNHGATAERSVRRRAEPDLDAAGGARFASVRGDVDNVMLLDGRAESWVDGGVLSGARAIRDEPARGLAAPEVLQRAGLISRGREAQWRPARLDASPIKEVAQWAYGFREYWQETFVRLDDLLDELQSEEMKKGGARGDDGE
jgi:hypothetical protein